MSNKIKTILIAGCIAGSLDILAAVTQSSIRLGYWNPQGVLKFVASGVFGKTAFNGGTEMAVYGLLFHFCIAFVFTIIYVTAYQFIPLLERLPVLCGMLYGIIVWTIMNQLVLPLSAAPSIPFKWDKALQAALILIVCMGLPIALITKRRLG